jgi:hypothetical protein
MDCLRAKIAGLAFAMALPSAPLWAQGQCQNLPKVVLQPGALVAPGYRGVGLAIKRGDSITPEVDTLPLDLTTLAQAQAFQQGLHRGESAVLLWTRADSTRCWSAIESAPQETEAAPAQRQRAPQTCHSVKGDWETIVRRHEKVGAYTLLVFDEKGNLCDFSREYGIEGDAIYVGIFMPGSASWGVTFENCALEPSGPRVYVPAVTFPDLRSGEVKGPRGEPVDLVTAGPRHCYSGQVDLVLRHDSGGSKAEYRYPLLQYRRYEATLQFGVLFSTLHDETFGLRPDSTIFSKGPTANGPEYAVSVVLYSLGRQVESLLAGRRYQGRDIVHDRNWKDLFGVMMAVSLQNPGRRFTAGLTLELLPGLNVLAGWEWARVHELAGMAEGDTLKADASAIPTKDVWRSQLVMGGSIDLNYVTALFSQKK